MGDCDDSDSDLEVIEEILNQNSDIGSKDIYLAEEEEEDHIPSDTESLLSIPSPSTSSSRQGCLEVHSAKMKLGCSNNYNCPKDDDLEVLPTPSSRRKSSTSGNESQKNSFSDPVSQEIDDLFEEMEFSSLKDYLENLEAKKKQLNPQTSRSSTSASGSSSQTSDKHSLPLPPQQAQSSKSKPKKLKLPTALELGPSSAFSLGSPDPPQQEKGKPIFGRTGSLGSPNKELLSYRIDPKQFRKTKKQTERGGKKTGKENSQSSSTGSSQFSSTSSTSVAAATSDVDSQNPPSVASSSSSTKPKAGDMRSVVLKIHEENCTDELASKLMDKELRFELMESAPVDGLILFERHMVVTAYDKAGQCAAKDITEPDENAMIIFPIEKHLELIQNEIDVINNDSNFSASSNSSTLTEWLQTAKKKLPGKKMTLLIQGHDAYIRKVRKNLDKEYKNRVLNPDQTEKGNEKKRRGGRSKITIQLTKTEIQSALIHAQLHTQINYRHYEKPAEISEMLYHYSKSIIDAPSKLARISQPGFDWYAVSDSVGGVPVEEDGKGMKSLWIQQLCQFPGVGQDSATAIARVYKNPNTLYKAYRECRTADEGKSLLSEIPVIMGVGPLKKTRRLGPEASKKIYRFFTSTDGEKEISV